MLGLMQDVPLSIAMIFDRAESFHRDRPIVTVTASGRERTTYRQWAERTRRLGSMLDHLGLAPARVGTFAWNTARHLELYFAAPCTGRVLHTLNIRLFPEQITYIVNHAADEVIFLDRSLAGLLAPLLDTFTTVRHLVVMDDGKGGIELPDGSVGWPPAGERPTTWHGIELHDYEEMLAQCDPMQWPELDDENRAASMCYTSGTTGNPKGVVYSHRSTVLHTMATMVANNIGVCERDVVLPVVPMFHANSWGLAHGAVAAGASLIMPGPDLSGPALADLIVEEKVSVAAGVPTIWQAVLPCLAGRDTSSLRVIPCGGSAVPRSLSEAYREQVGLPLYQAWGMTETSPVAACCSLTPAMDAWDEEARADQRTTVGRALFGVAFRVVEPDTTTKLPWDGETTGELQVRGNWIAEQYYSDPSGASSFTPDGWLRTGDVAQVDQYGFIRLVDRTKDLIKSGGEWISSVELENELMAHPQVAEAAVVGVPHPKWGERPLACVVLRPGAEVSRDDVLAWLKPKIAHWQLPDDVVFIEEVPKTSVGKFSKKDLRVRFAEHLLNG